MVCSKKYLIIVLIIFFLPVLIFPKDKNLKTSIIIPCTYKHFYLLDDLLSSFEKQTTLPNEVIISLSEADKLPIIDIEFLKAKKRNYVLKILQSNDKQSPGKNRNIAAGHAIGDILILQDADDISHPQRVEIVKYIFEHYNVDYIIHQWLPSDDWRQKNLDSFHNLPNDFKMYKHKKINYKIIKLKGLYYSKKDIEKLKTMHDIINSPLYKLCEKKMKYITWGQSCISKSVFKKVKWPEDHKQGEDVLFGHYVIKNFNNMILLKIPLIKYRIEYSSF